MASEVSGSSSSASATRTFSLAVLRVTPMRQASHSAQDPKPACCQSRCPSHSATAARKARVALVISL